MEKIVVVSTNNNPDYYFYAPYIKKAWNKLGWKLAVISTHDVDPKLIEADYNITFPEVAGIRLATQAQGSRLYAANFLPIDALIMTSDMDLLPLSDYWHPNPEKITVFGHDLTDYSFYPMGYVAMTGHKWREIMQLTYNSAEDMLRDAKETGIAFSEKWEEWWNFDWDLLTKRLKPLHNSLVLITRGRRLTGTYAYGRVDRADSMSIPPNETLIDAHCENHNVQHPEKLGKFISLFESVYGKL
jgi:hypothetical protein